MLVKQILGQYLRTLHPNMFRQMLKAPPLNSLGLYILILQCNCQIYHANIVQRLIFKCHSIGPILEDQYI